MCSGCKNLALFGQFIFLWILENRLFGTYIGQYVFQFFDWANFKRKKD